MAVVLFPYHLDEHLPDLAAELPPGLAYSCPEQAGTGSEHEHAPPREDIWHRLSALYEALADAVASAGDRPTVVSGDCTSVLGTMAGLQRAGVDPAVVWFDAHGDVQTLETTTSGYIGGYSLRMLVGYRPELIAEGLGLRPLDERRALLVDARDLDPPEVTYLATAGIRRCAVDGVDADVLPAGPLLLHLDLDVVDAAEVPGLRFPAPGGPSGAAVRAAAARVLDTGRVAAVSVAATWHAGADPSGRRARLLRDLTA